MGAPCSIIHEEGRWEDKMAAVMVLGLTSASVFITAQSTCLSVGRGANLPEVLLIQWEQRSNLPEPPTIHHHTRGLVLGLVYVAVAGISGRFDSFPVL